MASKEKLQTAFMNTAKEFAKLSQAKRLKVGGVMVRNNRIVCCAYNGTPSGFDNNCEDEINGELVTKREVIHCESNLLLAAGIEGIKTKGSTIYLTHSPCFACSLLIIQSGIVEVYYGQEYRVTNSLKFLEDCGVKTFKIEKEL